jgi:iron(III) transport system substrate-binding protein
MNRISRARAIALVTTIPFVQTAAYAAPIDDAGAIAAAKRDGSLSLYSAISQPQTVAISQRFEATYGIPVKTLRMDSSPLASRIATEQRGGRFEADISFLPGFETDQLKRGGVLAEFRPPEARALMPQTVDADGMWAGMFLNSEAIAYNPDKVRELGLKPPTSWDDLCAPAWRGRLGMYAAGYEWSSALKRYLGVDRAETILRGYAANEVRLIPSHSLCVNLVAAGEIIASPNIYGYDALAEQSKGRPIALVNPNPTPFEVLCVAVIKAAPHPAAARLFERWLLSSDTQAWIRDELKRVSPRKDVKNDPRLLDPKVRNVISRPSDSVGYNDVVRAFDEIYHVGGN